MASRKKKNDSAPDKKTTASAYIAGAGVVVNQPIIETLEKNYMPYAMSVIVSRAIPEIDGFKPSHRKLLYTMYLMGLLTGSRTKSANIVGQTMKLNPHGDQTIYETMVRLARGSEALLHPYVDSKGNFGKVYSRDMAYAASRYTEAKLAPISAELFSDIAKDTVDFADNYDGTLKEPTLLPVRFPSILVNANMGIAVGMASSICPFNLTEVCNTAIALMKNPDHPLLDTLPAPDFPGGGELLFDAETLSRIYDTGRGSFRVRARYRVDPKNSCIELYEIPPTTTVEVIMDKIVDLVKLGRVKEIADQRDETDLSGLKLTLDYKRGVDPERLMQKLYKMTPLEDSFACNFNILVSGTPQVMGVRQILTEWLAFRRECVRRRLYFDLSKRREKLHLLKGLAAILLDIDKAVRIVRESEEESEVVPNLMIGFGIDEVQAEYVAEIKLRHLNRAYILNRTKEIEALISEIAEMEDILASPRRISALIADELREVSKKHAQPRRTVILYDYLDEEPMEDDEESDYAVHIFLTREGYFKKTTPQSLRMSGEQKLKEGDEISQTFEVKNSAELLFFTDKGQVYKSRAPDFEDSRISLLGEYLPARLEMDEGEGVRFMVTTQDYTGFMLFFFENGKVARVPLSAYETKTRRRKLIGAYNTASKLAGLCFMQEEGDVLLTSSAGRALVVSSTKIGEKTKRDTVGVSAMSLKKNAVGQSIAPLSPERAQALSRFVVRSLPAVGGIPKDDEIYEQTTL